MGYSEVPLELFQPQQSISVSSHIAQFPGEREKVFQYFHDLCYHDWDDIGYMMKAEDDDITFFLNKVGSHECLHLVEFTGRLDYIIRLVRQMGVLLNTPYYFITASFCFGEDNRDKLIEIIDVVSSFSPNCGNFTSLRYEKNIAPGDAFVGLYFIADAMPRKLEGHIVSVSVNTRRNTAVSIEDFNRAIREGNFPEAYLLLTEDRKRNVREYINILLKKQKVEAWKENIPESAHARKVTQCSFCKKDSSAVNKLFSLILVTNRLLSATNVYTCAILLWGKVRSK